MSWTVENERMTLSFAGSTLDLMNGANGFRLVENSTTRQFDTEGQVFEQIMTVQTTGASAIGVPLQHLIRFKEQAKKTIDGYSEFNVLLSQRATGETQNTISAVLDIEYAPGTENSLYSYRTSNAGFERYMVRVLRGPLENSSSCSIISNSLSSLGGTVNYPGPTGHVDGDMPARLSRLQLALDGAAFSGDMTEFWVSFRTNINGGDGSVFQPVWDFGASARDLNNNTVSGVSASANGGVAAIWTPGASSISHISRVTIDAFSALSNINNARYQQGEHSLLLRARSTGDRAFSVQAFTKPAFNSTGRDLTSRFAVSGSFFKLYPAGVMSVPFRRGNTSHMVFTAKNAGLDIKASVQSGTTGNLEIDCLLLMPRDEGLLYYNTGDTALATDSAGTLFGTHDRNMVQSATVRTDLAAASGFVYNDNVEYNGDLLLPVGLSNTGEGWAIFAFQDADRHRLGDRISLSLTWVPRWARIAL